MAELSAWLLVGLKVSAAVEPPVVPIGFDAYRHWDKWPYQRIGVRAYMRSTYDRRGGNEGADASHFLYQLADDQNVTLDVEGPGILCFARYNHWHGSPWHYIVDGIDHIVTETTTHDPLKPVENSIFRPQNLFPSPLAVTWSATRGADLSWVPIPFEKSFRMAYSRTHYGTGYYIYHQFVRGTRLSQPIKSWDAKSEPPPDVLDLFNLAGTDISPPITAGAKGMLARLEPGTANTLIFLKRPASMIRKLAFLLPKDQAYDFGQARLRITWDDRKEPSVDAPIALFFGAGTLYNRDGRGYLVKAFPAFVRYDRDQVELACFFPMPYFKSARIELVGPASTTVSNISWNVKATPLYSQPNELGYFHATYHGHPRPERGKDLLLLDTRQTEGGGDWSGSFIGTSWIFSDRAFLGTLEGDPRFFFDDSQTPQAYGTGTEEWGGGGDYWGGLNMTLPFAGHPTGAKNIKEAKEERDQIESAYRFLLGDLLPFGKNAVIRLEHGGENESTEHYQTVTYWYGAPAPSLIRTDSLKIADTKSEASHKYHSPDASPPYEINSRYEWGVDNARPEKGSTNPPIEIYPAHSDRGRKTTGVSEFTIRLDPKNLGVLLRRKLDYSFPNQRAEVFVADVHGSNSEKDWKPAGVWYLAGANTCVYSNPKDELGETQHNVQTSNRRFRDDEFLLPRDLTEGRSSIRVRIKFTPVNIPFFPGQPVPELAWSEIRYDAYCFVLPKWGAHLK